MVEECCFSTPRIIMHKCLASITTPTPRGLTAFESAPRGRGVSGNSSAAGKDKLHLWMTCTMAEMANSKKRWKGEASFINQEVLIRHLDHLQGPIYYIAGPPATVIALRNKVGEDDIRTEEFGGY